MLSSRSCREPGVQATLRGRVALLASPRGGGGAPRLPEPIAVGFEPLPELREDQDTSRRRGARPRLQGPLLHGLSIQHAQRADDDGSWFVSERMHPVRSSEIRTGNGAVESWTDAAAAVAHLPVLVGWWRWTSQCVQLGSGR